MGKSRLAYDRCSHKNLGIEDILSNALGSNHHPYHFLCKSHTVEALDRSNLNMLAEVKKSVKQQEIFEGINPSIRFFFPGKSALVEAGIEALLNLITHDKSGRSCSQADLFDHICEREGITKSIFIPTKAVCQIGKRSCSFDEYQRSFDYTAR